jgi:hypothetical protein
MKILIREIPDSDVDTRWFWVVLKWTDQPCYLGDGSIRSGSENGCWFNASCGHSFNYPTAAQMAYQAYQALKQG